MKVFRRIILVLLSVLVVCGLAFVIYTSNYYQAVDVDRYLPLDVKTSDKIQSVSNDVRCEIIDDNIWFYPKNKTAQEEAFVFYPGGKVESSAYAPIMYMLAQRGYISVIVDMPFNLAMFGVNGANNVISRNDKINNVDYSDKKWFIGGHSLGGAFAAKYYSQHTNMISGLVLLASYSTYDLTKYSNSNVLSIYGSCDKVLNMDKYNSNKSNLPSNFVEHIIDGGNHGQFGSYGNQSGDGEATISALSQWTITTNYIIDFMEA